MDGSRRPPAPAWFHAPTPAVPSCSRCCAGCRGSSCPAGLCHHAGTAGRRQALMGAFPLEQAGAGCGPPHPNTTLRHLRAWTFPSHRCPKGAARCWERAEEHQRAIETGLGLLSPVCPQLRRVHSGEHARVPRCAKPSDRCWLCWWHRGCRAAW